MNLEKLFEVITPISHFKKLYEKYNCEWDEINIIGIRHNEDQRNDVFNDVIGIVTDNTFNFFNATTDPGAFWTKSGGANADHSGVAHLCPGFYKDAYIVGKHYDQTALVQRGGPVEIWRDENRNFLNDDNNNVHLGYFGINIHRAAKDTVTEKIGKWSAGCQVIQDSKDFDIFMSIILNSEKYKKNKSAKFSYLLLNEKQFYI